MAGETNLVTACSVITMTRSSVGNWDGVQADCKVLGELSGFRILHYCGNRANEKR